MRLSPPGKQLARELSDEERLRAVGRVLAVTLALNLGVAIAKIVYGNLSRSLSISADGYHSLTDSANNLVGLLGVYIAARPADENHPYGHHKFEIIAAGVVGLSLLAMAYEVAHGAINRLIEGKALAPELDIWAVVVLLATLAVNSGVASWERKRGEELASVMLLGDATHTRSDVLVTSGVVISTLCVRFGYTKVDVIAALLIAAFIAYAGVQVLRANLGYLSDSALLDPEGIDEVARGVPGVKSTHKIRTRGSPGRIYVDLHIQVTRSLNVVDAHSVTHAVIDAIKQKYPDVRDVLIHTEPAAAPNAEITAPHA